MRLEHLNVFHLIFWLFVGAKYSSHRVNFEVFFLESVRKNNLFHVCHFHATSANLLFFFLSLCSLCVSAYFNAHIYWFVVEFMVDFLSYAANKTA